MPLRTLKDVARLAMSRDGSIKTRVLRSGIWVAASNLLGSGLNVIRSVVLARLLTPEAFGIMGLASVALRAIETVTRAGISQALIARTESFEEAAGTAFTLLFLRGLLLAGLLAVAAPFIANFYDSEQLAPILQVLALVFVAGGLNNINVIVRQKELDFRHLTYLNLAATTVGTIATLVMAFWLRSVWALVIGQVVTTFLNTALSYYFIDGRPRFSWNPGIARDLLQYGKFITGSSMVLFAASEIDSAVIGKVLGVEQLGFYALAATIAGMATANVSRVASGIMMPAYSKLQSDQASLRAAFLRTLSLVALVVLPASIGLILVAEPLIRLVYGSRWLPAVVPLQILAVFGLIRAFASFNGYLFEGMGQPKVAFQLGAMRLIAVVPLIFLLTGEFGLDGAAIAVVCGIAIQWLAGFYYLRSHLGLRPSHLFVAMGRPARTTCWMALSIVGSKAVLGTEHLSGLIAVVAIGALTYLAFNFGEIKSLREDIRS